MVETVEKMGQILRQLFETSVSFADITPAPCCFPESCKAETVLNFFASNKQRHT